jgi:hypothetical protein
MYDTEVGRMLAVDNYVLNTHSSQDYNRYSYARNNPLKYSDPSGESIVPVIVALAGAYLGGASANGTLNPGKWDYNSPTTWVGIGTGALMGAGAGALGASGQLSYFVGTSVGGVSIGGIALNNTGSNYDLNLFAGSSSSGYNYNLGSVKNRKYNPNPFASLDAYVDYASLPPANPRVTPGALITEFTDAEYLQMGATQDQIDYYRKSGNLILTAEEFAEAMGALSVLQNGVTKMMDYANVLSTDPKFRSLMKNGGRLLGVPSAIASIDAAMEDPSLGSWTKATVNTAAIFAGPYSGTVLFLLDQTGVTTKMYNGLDDAMDRINW